MKVNGKPTKIRIGSRGSQLALWQANHISALLRARGHEVEIEIIHTTGDKITDVALAKVGTKGMFTKEIEEALAAGIKKLLTDRDTYARFRAEARARRFRSWSDYTEKLIEHLQPLSLRAPTRRVERV